MKPGSTAGINRKSQLIWLTRHFFDRFFDRDSISGGSDPRANVIQMLGILAVPGMMLGFWTMLSRSNIFLRYFFVSYSMIAMGFLMVYKWDSLFPDRRDYLILGSLPFRYRDLFAAKACALALFMGLFAADINFFSTFFVPAGGGGAFWQRLLAHLAGVFGGALFMALGFGALQGILINVLPQQTFRRISPVVQMIALSILLTAFMLFPLIASAIQPLAERASEIMDYFPIFWFLGLYEYLVPNGDPNPAFAALALKAVYGLAAAAGLSALAYGIAYRRYARCIVETMDFKAPRDGESYFSRAAHRMESLILNHPVRRGCFRFIGSILARSSRHQVFLALYGGIGLSIALSSLFYVDPRADFPFRISPRGMLELPIILAFFVVSGLRATFNIPSELPANWLFQLTEGRDSREYVAAIRTWVILCGILPLMALMAPIEFSYWPWEEALFHLVFLAMISVILLHVLFFNFRKVPFTCSYYPGKTNLTLLAVVYLYGFTTYSSSMAALERWLLGGTSRSFLFLAAAVSGIAALSAARRRRDGARLIYEDQPDPLVRGLGLN